jgi:predicted ATPase
MLARASFQNFKALKAVDVDLTPFTVIVGKNGSGKTSVLQGILDVSQVPVRRADEPHPAQRLGLIFGGNHDPARLVSRPGDGPLRIVLTGAEDGTLSVEAKPAPADDKQQRAIFLVTASGNGPASISLPSAPTSQAHQEVEQFLASPAVQRFGSAVFLRLDAGVMMKPSATISEAPQLDHDGEGLASVLSYMAGAEPEALDAVRNDLAAVVPQVRRIRTFPAQIPPAVGAGGSPVMGHRFALDMGEGRLVPADMLSEGTVLALGLLTALRHPQCPRLILMDDIDGALHSSAQAELVRCLRKIQKDRPDVQIVCTSHSADLLDHVALEEVRVMVLDAEGYARCGRLSDHPQSAEWRRMLRTGEFWASVGEDWLLEAPAGAP